MHFYIVAVNKLQLKLFQPHLKEEVYKNKLNRRIARVKHQNLQTIAKILSNTK